ncbi:MAG: MarR family winged helix-turn-helix transcriptional regulator [Pseudomonadota bacterium]
MADNDFMAMGGFVLNASPSHLLHRAQQVASIKSAPALKAAGITLRQFSVLAAVAEAEGASQSRLVDTTGIDRSTLADMVQRMEDSGLIVRTQSQTDARAKAVALTARGRQALDIAAPAVRDADLALLAALPKSRRGAFVEILAKLTGTDLEADAGAPGKVKTKSAEKAKDKTKKKKDRPKDKKELKSKAAKKDRSGKKTKNRS